MAKKELGPDLSKLPDVIIVNPTKATTKKKGRQPDWQTRKSKPKVPGKVSGNRTHYSDQLKMEVVCSYAVCGNARRVAEIHGIPEGTVRAWKTTEWWNEVTARIRQEEDEELDTKLTKLLNKAVEGVNDRLEEGDWLYDAKKGELLRKPINAKDLAIITAITVDKRELLRGKPTSRVEKVGENDRLERLQQQFRNFTAAKEITQEVEVIEEEVLEEIEENVIEQETINELFGYPE